MTEEGAESINPSLHTTELLTECGMWQIQAGDPGACGVDEEIYRSSTMDKGDRFRTCIQAQFSGLHMELESGSPANTLSHLLLP